MPRIGRFSRGGPSCCTLRWTPPTCRGRFREEKRIALLTSPILSEGTIAYARPGRLARRTTQPTAQTVLIDGASLRMSEGGREQRIDLASQPVVRSFVDSFVQLLAGDRAALERSYTITFTPGAAGAWSITLRPRVTPLDRFLTSIVLDGTGTSLSRMVMTEVSGDVTTTSFSEVDRAHRFSTAEAARVFSL